MTKTSSKGNIFSDLTWKGWIGLVSVILILIGFGFGQYQKDLKSTAPVSSQQVKQAVDDGRHVVFYRDNCPACKKAMPMLKARNLIKKDTLFVNTNGKENKKLAQEYGIKSVPSVLNQNGILASSNTGSITDHMMPAHDDFDFTAPATTDFS